QQAGAADHARPRRAAGPSRGAPQPLIRAVHSRHRHLHLAVGGHLLCLVVHPRLLRRRHRDDLLVLAGQEKDVRRSRARAARPRRQGGGRMSGRLARALDVSELPHGTADSRALLWWGNLGMMTIEGTMFAMMIATYLYL